MVSLMAIISLRGTRELARVVAHLGDGVVLVEAPAVEAPAVEAPVEEALGVLVGVVGVMVEVVDGVKPLCSLLWDGLILTSQYQCPLTWYT
jgi:hypothetical protein